MKGNTPGSLTAPEQFDVLGVSISAVNMEQAVAVMDDWITGGHKDYVVLTGAHGVIEMQKDQELRRINNEAGMVTPDGMPNVWIGRIKGHKHVEKVYAPTIMMETYQFGLERGYKHFFYGGKEGVADKLAKKMDEKYPGIRIVGSYCPPFRPLTASEKGDVAEKINATKPDIVWVGLGCPKQERWMKEFHPLLGAPVLIGVGAGFDFLAGERPLAPKWIQNSGLEWLYRLFSDPKHLWRRYGRVVPLFIFLNVLEFLGLRRNQPLEGEK